MHVEDSPSTQERIAEAVTLYDRGRVEDAAAMLHAVIAEQGDRLVRGGDEDAAGLYVSAAGRVWRELDRRPPLAAAYRATRDAAARRSLQQAAEPVIDEAAVREVAWIDRYTPAGLDAGLLLAGLELERLDVDEALDRLRDLRDHANLDRRADDHARLTAMARLLSGEANAIDAAAAGLALSDAARSEAAALAASLDGGTWRTGPYGQARPAMGDPAAVLGQPLWELRFDAGRATGSRAAIDSRLRRQLEARRGEQPDLPAVAAGERLIFNDGRGVMAIDRDSGRLLWRTEQVTERLIEAEADPRVRMAILSAAGRVAPEVRGAAARGEAVFAVMGTVSGWEHRVGAHRDTELVRLNAATGKRRWTVTPEAVDETLARGYFTGTPTVAGDRVIAVVRRSQVSGVQDVFVVGVSAASGEPAWKRHVASAVTTSRYASGPPPQVAVRGNRLYVSTGVAGVACIDADTGRVRWTRLLTRDRMTVERAMGGGVAEQPGRLSPPLLLPAGLVVGLPTGDAHAFVLDPDTGAIRRRLSDAAWRPDHARLAVGGDVLSVGLRVRRFDGRTLEPRWSTRLAADDHPAAEGAVSGMPAATESHLVVPTETGLVVLTLDDGQVVRRLPGASGGHVTALPGQLVVSDPQRAASYLSWDSARARLTRAIADRTRDPGPALGLAHLALVLGHNHVLGEALDAAVDAAVRAGGEPVGLDGNTDGGDDPIPGDAVRRNTFDRLKRLASDAPEQRPAAAAAVIARLGQLAATPAERATYHLMRGANLAEADRVAEAVEHFQAVLESEAMSTELYETDRASRRAGIEAQRRLGEVLDRRGASAYATLAARAEAELARLTAGTGRSPDALASLARRYPFAPAAPAALLEAARAQRLLDRPDEALRSLRRAYDLAEQTRGNDAPAHNDLPAILGEIVTLQLAFDRPREAAAWLRRTRREHPGTFPVADGAARDPAAWLAEIEPLADARSALPRFTPPLSAPRRLEGAPLPSLPAVAAGDPLLIRHDPHVLAVDPQTLEVRWRARGVPDDAVLVARSRDRLVLFSASDQAVLALDAATAGQAWRRSADSLFAGLPTAETAKDEQAPQREAFMRIVRDTRRAEASPRPPVASGEGLVVWADERGRVAAMDARTGDLAWRRTLGLDRVRGVSVSGSGVVLWGEAGSGTGSAAGAVEVLSPLAGEPRLGIVETPEPPVHAAAIDERLLIATATQASARRLGDGRLAWRTRVVGPSLVGGGWLVEGAAAYADEAGQAVGFDLDSGAMAWRVPVGHGEGDPIRGAVTEGRSLTLGARGGVATIDPDDGLRWRDAIAMPRKRLLAFAVAHRHVAVLADAGGVNVPIFGDVPDQLEPSPRARLLLIERDTGRIAYDYALDPVPTPIDDARTRLTDRWLLLSNGSETIAVPGRRGDSTDAASDAGSAATSE